MNEPIKAQNAETGRVYYSRKGTPAKIISREKKHDGSYEIVVDANPGTEKSQHTVVTGDYDLFEKPPGTRQPQPKETGQPAAGPTSKTAKKAKVEKTEKEDSVPKKRKARASKQAMIRANWQKLGPAEVIKRYQTAKKEFGAPPKLPKNMFLIGLLLEAPRTTEEMVQALRKAYKCSEKTARNRLNKFHLNNRTYLESDGTKKGPDGGERIVYKFIKK
jgi:hypothetical protein